MAVSFAVTTKNDVISDLIMRLTAAIIAVIAVSSAILPAQVKPSLSSEETPIAAQLRGLRKVPDDERAGVTRDLAMKIRRLPVTVNKLHLATQVAFLSTEGDFGAQTVQEVATTLADALREQPLPDQEGKPAMAYVALAQLVRYEQARVSLDSPAFSAALAKVDADEQRRASVNFTLPDLSGKKWTLSELRGKVVLVNFWATWCPPCRKEMPDLGDLYSRFKKQGFVILAISDEDAAKVGPFVKDQDVKYPVLLDAGRKVNELFAVDGIPKSFIYNREGKLVATAIDMRTKGQFMAMLAKAGLN